MPSTLILREQANKRTTYIHLRGDFLQKGKVVEPGGMNFLAPFAGKQLDRLDLARWLVSPEQPLTARVYVNRAWQQFFGRGLVETENDFGMQGALPSHPDLLDWLARDFVAQKWSVKQLHRRIVTSATYRQASTTTPELLKRDPDNRLLARQSRLRVEAEIIRDIALCASGTLSPKQGGPGVYPPLPQEVFSFTQNKKAWPTSTGEARYRRGIYTFLWRSLLPPLSTTFDGADAVVSCTRRNRSNTPLQALHLANDEAFLELAEAFAQRIVAEVPESDIDRRIDYAFRVAVGREPEPAEVERLHTYFVKEQAKDAKTAWKMLARVLINLDEFITRE